MAAPNEIGWGSYKDYEGAYYRGKHPFKVLGQMTDAQKIIAVITATEGGKYDAINMYDRMILSVGLIQYGEAGQYSVSDMLGAVHEHGDTLLAPLDEILANLGATFQPNARGRWRFSVAGNEVDTIAEQQQLFLRCDGHIGSWGPADSPRRAWAKRWAAAVATVFEAASAQEAQVDFIVPRLRSFAMPNAKAALWGAGTPTDTMGWPAAVRAAFLSFAANLPAVAGEQLGLALAGLGGVPAWTKDWVIAILKQLTFGPGITIYPERYNKIRPVLEAQYGVDLPDFAAELKAWQVQMGVDPSSDVPAFTTVKDVQEELLALGYDLGPAGADGKLGPKTKDAIMTFQRLAGLKPDGLVGPQTRKALAASWMARNLPSAGFSSAFGSSAGAEGGAGSVGGRGSLFGSSALGADPGSGARFLVMKSGKVATASSFLGSSGTGAGLAFGAAVFLGGSGFLAGAGAGAWGT